MTFMLYCVSVVVRQFCCLYQQKLNHGWKYSLNCKEQQGGASNYLALKKWKEDSNIYWSGRMPAAVWRRNLPEGNFGYLQP